MSTEVRPGTSPSTAARRAGPVLTRRPSGALLPQLPQRPAWEALYTAGLVVLDGLLITIAAAIALSVRFGSLDNPSLAIDSSRLPYGVIAALFAPAWVALLAAGRSYEARFCGAGSEEYKRVINSSIRFTALVMSTAFVVRADLSRGFLATVLPVGFVLLLVGRFGARKVLLRLRLRGVAVHRTVVVGNADDIVALVRRLDQVPGAAMDVVGACLPDLSLTGAPPPELVLGDRVIPVLGPARGLASRLGEVGADTVAVLSRGGLSARELRELSWQLEGQGVDLALSPGLTDVAGPRIHVRPMAGLPLLHVEEPSFGGLRRVVKGLFDRTAALALLLAFAPLMIVLATLVKREDGGPVLYKQERVGRMGRTFRIWKFRSMHVDADRRLADLAATNEHDGPLFKMRVDPRLTRIGTRLRRHSLDELPQLFNVVFGSMSLVGPRPPLQSEVDQYDPHVHRRLLVKPGMTGLWQVSGRADLDWEETVRLDLYYVENWSVAFDLMILWRTLATVISGKGAY
jgi:exopolysaccharide biosynthesis polyprenyl glycosylphosphotransferase